MICTCASSDENLDRCRSLMPDSNPAARPPPTVAPRSPTRGNSARCGPAHRGMRVSRLRTVDILRSRTQHSAPVHAPRLRLDREARASRASQAAAFWRPGGGGGPCPGPTGPSTVVVVVASVFRGDSGSGRCGRGDLLWPRRKTASNATSCTSCRGEVAEPIRRIISAARPHASSGLGPP